LAVPYQLHQRKLNHRQQHQGITTTPTRSSFNALQNKPFWIWDKQEHLAMAMDTNEQYCFNHIVGLPIKDNKEFPLFDYEKIGL